MLFGLHAILPQPATYITVLREPVDRVLSSFYFMRNYKLHPLYWKFRRENWSLEDFVRRSPRDNVQCKILAGVEYAKPFTEEIYETAKENLLRHFSVVGLSERFEESLALMKLRFGWKLQRYSSFNVTRTRPRKTDISRSTLDLIEEKNSFDISLYEYAAKIFQTAVNARAAEVSQITRELESARDANSDSAWVGAILDPCGWAEGYEQSLFQYLGSKVFCRNSLAALRAPMTNTFSQPLEIANAKTYRAGGRLLTECVFPRARTASERPAPRLTNRGDRLGLRRRPVFEWSAQTHS